MKTISNENFLDSLPEKLAEHLVKFRSRYSRKDDRLVVSEYISHIAEYDIANKGFLGLFKIFADVYTNGDIHAFRELLKKETCVKMTTDDGYPNVILRSGFAPTQMFLYILLARIVNMCRKLSFLLKGSRWSNKCLKKKLDECYARLEDKKELIDKQSKVNIYAQNQLAKQIINLEAENNRLRDLLFHVETNGLGLNWFNAFSRFKKLQAEAEQLKSKLR